jgi:hypothetical protein
LSRRDGALPDAMIREARVSSPSVPTTAVRPVAATPPSSTWTFERTLASATTLNVLVALAIALRLVAYASGVSLWLDELLLTRNIVGLPLRDLMTRPLLLDQVAPRGFLAVEKLAVLAFGANELSLRLFPFLCSIASVVLFRRLAERVLDGLAVPLAVALFAIGVPFIQYGVEVKQYIVDATVAVGLLLAALALCAPNVSTRRLVAIGLLGWLVIWFSQASVVVMGGLGAAFAARWLSTRDRATARVLAITVPLWAAASLVAVFAGLRAMSPATREFMDDFWHGGFLPAPLSMSTAFGWLWNQALSVFTDPTLLRYRLPVVFLALTVIGVVSLWRQRRGTALLLLGPFGVALVAAVAHQYPLRGRLMFYLVPSVLLLMAAGSGWVARQLRRLHPALGVLVMMALLVPPALTLAEDPPPYEIEHSRTMFAYLQRVRQPGDVLHVFPLSRIATLHYGPRYGLTMRDWTTSVCDRADTRAYVRDVDRYRGKPRVWLLTTGIRPFRTARAAVRGYLSTIGVKRDSLVRQSLTMGSVSLELFDLSDSVRLRATDAESFPVQPMPTDPRPGCRPWASPSPLDSLR